MIPWSPLARGRLARPWDTHTNRSESDPFGRRLYDDSDAALAEAAAHVARQRGVPMAQVGLAWLLSKPVVTAPFVGMTPYQPHATNF